MPLKIYLIAAVCNGNGIGNRGTIPWHVPEDLRHFRMTTSGHTVVMGRKTYESIGKPLPNRQNIVITSRNNGAGLREGTDVMLRFVASPEDMLVDFDGDDRSVFIIGGQQVYKYFLPYADGVYLTRIHKEYECDAHFPIDMNDCTDFELVEQSDLCWSDRGACEYQFQFFGRKM